MKKTTILLIMIMFLFGNISTIIIDASEYKNNDSSSIVSDIETLKEVQNMLNDLGYDCGSPDGIIGEKSKASITQYKSDHNMDPSPEVTELFVEELTEDYQKENALITDIDELHDIIEHQSTLTDVSVREVKEGKKGNKYFVLDIEKYGSYEVQDYPDEALSKTLIISLNTVHDGNDWVGLAFASSIVLGVMKDISATDASEIIKEALLDPDTLKTGDDHGGPVFVRYQEKDNAVILAYPTWHY